MSVSIKSQTCMKIDFEIPFQQYRKIYITKIKLLTHTKVIMAFRYFYMDSQFLWYFFIFFYKKMNFHRKKSGVFSTLVFRDCLWISPHSDQFQPFMFIYPFLYRKSYFIGINKVRGQIKQSCRFTDLVHKLIPIYNFGSEAKRPCTSRKNFIFLALCIFDCVHTQIDTDA